MKIKGLKMNFETNEKLKDPKVPMDFKPVKVALRVLVVLVFIYMMIITAIYLSDAKGRAIRQQTDLIDEFFRTPEKFTNQQGYYSFAGQFLRDYLTKGSAENSMALYSNREIQVAWPPNLKEQTVLETYPVKITRINENQSVVRMGAYVSSIFIPKIQGDPNLIKQQTLYFDLAVYQNGEQYVINQLPQVIATQAKAEEKYRQMKLNEVSGDGAAQIMEDVDSFIKAYLEGSENDIAYFTTLDLKGLKGAVKYNSIDRSQVYILPEDKNKALVKIDVITDLEGTIMKQHYELSLEKKDKWKVNFIGALCPDFEKYITENQEE